MYFIWCETNVIQIENSVSDHINPMYTNFTNLLRDPDKGKVLFKRPKFSPFSNTVLCTGLSDAAAVHAAGGSHSTNSAVSSCSGFVIVRPSNYINGKSLYRHWLFSFSLMSERKTFELQLQNWQCEEFRSAKKWWLNSMRWLNSHN